MLLLVCANMLHGCLNDYQFSGGEEGEGGFKRERRGSVQGEGEEGKVQGEGKGEHLCSQAAWAALFMLFLTACVSFRPRDGPCLPLR